MPELRRDPPPLRTNDAKTVAVGTGLWLLLLIALLVGHDRVRRDERWWYATCVCGIALGLLGLLYLKIRPAQLARKERARDEVRSARR